MNVVDAMAKRLGSGIRMILDRRSLPIRGGTDDLIFDHQPFSDIAMESFMFNTSNAMPFIPEWNVDNLLPDLEVPWNVGVPDGQDLFLQMNQ